MTISRRSRRLSDVMVVTEVALALMLLVGAGPADSQLRQPHVGEPRVPDVAASCRSRSCCPRRDMPDGAAKREFYSALVDGVRALPGVRHAGAVSALPLSPLGTQFDIPFTIDGLSATAPSDRPRAAYRAVMAGYFEAMAIPLVKGRLFDTVRRPRQGAARRHRQRDAGEALLRRRRSAQQRGEDADGRRPDDRRRRRRREARRPAAGGQARGLRAVLPAGAIRDADRGAVGCGCRRRWRPR